MYADLQLRANCESKRVTVQVVEKGPRKEPLTG
jgi:hypothetical protein